MSTPAAQWIDAAIGETRTLVELAGRPARLDIARWSDEGRRARWGETYVGRVRKIEPALRGAFIDLGLKEEQGFLPFDSHGHIRIGANVHRAVLEGEAILLRVAREGANGKSPVMAFIEEGRANAALGRVARAERDHAPREAAAADIRARIDSAIDLALARVVALRGGGRLIIDRTAALTVIDVDAGGRRGARDPEVFARDLNIEAAYEAIEHLSLRSQGGLAAIDFVSMRSAANRKAVEAALKAAAKGDHWGVAIAPMSRFGVVELSRAQLTRPIHEIMCDPSGVKSAETVALEALRALEREAPGARGRRLVARMPRAAIDWLAGESIAWRAALTERIGTLWDIEAAPAGERETIDVRTVS